MTFAERLTRYRERQGLSQVKLAGRIGCNYSTISRLESGTRGPSRGMVIDLAAGLALDRIDRDRLLVAAGYAPTDPASYLEAAFPEVAEAAAMLNNGHLSDEVAQRLRSRIGLATRQARLAMETT